MLMKVLISPGKYVQGPGSLRQLEDYAKNLGQSALVVASATSMKKAGQRLEEGLGSIKATVEEFQRETSKKEINRLVEVGKKQEADFVIGFGGGKAIDTAKAVAYYLDKPVAIIPSMASTDAPTSALSVIYTDDGVFEEFLVLPHNPNLVLMDTELVAEAPVRSLVAGMGDALATKFEAEAALSARAAALAGGYSTMTALTLADLCYQTLIEFGPAAKTAVENNAVTPALERVVEANTLLSGLGFESGGLAAAHAIHNGLTVLEETHGALHGEKVSLGTLAQLVMEDRPMEEILEVLDFCNEVGLTTTFSGLGADGVTDEEIWKVAESATAEGETIYSHPFPIHARMVYDALKGADALGRAYQD